MRKLRLPQSVTVTLVTIRIHLVFGDIFDDFERTSLEYIRLFRQIQKGLFFYFQIIFSILKSIVNRYTACLSFRKPLSVAL